MDGRAAHRQLQCSRRQARHEVAAQRLREDPVKLSGRVQSASPCPLWMADGETPKHLRNARLKCEELENPQEKATSVMVVPPCASSSCRQCCSRARQM